MHKTTPLGHIHTAEKWPIGHILAQATGYIRLFIQSFPEFNRNYRSFIPQHAVYVSAPLAAHEVSDNQVSQEQYPEYQHQHQIFNQPVLGKECDKAEEQH